MKILDQILLEKSPKWFKLFIANILVRCLNLGDKEYPLYYELKLYINKK